MGYKKKINFASAGSYSNAGATGTVTDDTTNGWLALTAPINTTTRARVTAAAALTMPFLIGSKYGAFRLVFNTDVPATIQTIAVYISLDTAYTVSGYFKVSAGNFIKGRNEVVFSWDSFVPPAGKTADDFKMSPILSWQVNLQSTTVDASSIGLVSFDAIDPARGAVCFTADDALAEQWLMYQVLKNNGFNGAMTVAVIPAKIDTAGYLTLAQLREMAKDGCSICNHTMNHTVLDTVTDTEQRKELGLCHDWLSDSVAGSDPSKIIYPQGGYNDTTISIVSTKYTLGRTVKEGLMTPNNDKYQLKVINLLPTVTVDTVKKYIDRATNDGVGVIFLMHRLMENEPDVNTPTTYWVTSRMYEAIAYARNVGAPVMNLSQFATTFLK